MLSNKPFSKSQSGIAILMSLLVTTVVTSLSIAWYMQNRMNIRRTQQLVVSDQSYLYSQAVVDWAIGELIIDVNVSSSNKKNWPKIFSPTSISHNKGIISGSIEDYQARLNINNLAEKESRNAFIKLTQMTNNLSPLDASKLADSILAWITPIKLQTSAMLNINSQYALHNPPYTSANNPIKFLSELRMVAGMTSSIYTHLAPYLCALPTNTPINFSYASPMILRAFNVQKTISDSEKSKFFLVKSNIKLSHQTLKLSTLLYREKQNGKTHVGVIWQSQGNDND